MKPEHKKLTRETTLQAHMFYMASLMKRAVDEGVLSYETTGALLGAMSKAKGLCGDVRNVLTP